MAQLEAFEIPGFSLEMYPEDHSPPHFHIIKDNWNIRIKFNLSIIKNNIAWDAKHPKNLKEVPLSSSELTTLLNLIKENRKTLNKQWQDLHPNRQGQKHGGNTKEADHNRSRNVGEKGDQKS